MGMTRTRRLGLLLAVLVAALLSASPASQASSTGLDEREVVQLINELRAARGLVPLKSAAPLVRSARAHSADMGRRAYFSHTTETTGADYTQRILRQSPGTVRWLGETIGWGVGAPGTPRGLVQAWMQSPPHRQTILDRRFRRVGLGAWRGTFEGYAGVTVYTANFAG
jgi:uncharacterized protein YkwD